MIVAQHAIFAHLFGMTEAENVFGYSLARERSKVLVNGPAVIHSGLVRLLSPYTMEQALHEYILIVEEDFGFSCFSREVQDQSDYQELEAKLSSIAETKDKDAAKEARAFARGYLDTEPVTLRDLFQEDRETVAGSLAAKRLTRIYRALDELFDENKELLSLLKESHVQAPRALLAPSEIALTRRLTEEVSRWERSLEQSTLAGIKSVLQDAAMCGIEIDKEAASVSFSELIIEKIRTAVEGKSSEMIHSILAFVELSANIDVKLDESSIQDELFDLLESSLEELSREGKEIDGENRDFFESLLALAERFNFNTERWRAALTTSAGGG
jgi:hypothetical protein